MKKWGSKAERRPRPDIPQQRMCLEKLAPEYPIIQDILEYRQLAKLKSTYADGLAECDCRRTEGSIPPSTRRLQPPEESAVQSPIFRTFPYVWNLDA